MTFEVRNRLMVLLNDDVVAHGIAQEFVQDDPQKLEVFERCYRGCNYSGQPRETASIAKDKAKAIWTDVYETA